MVLDVTLPFGGADIAQPCSCLVPLRTTDARLSHKLTIYVQCLIKEMHHEILCRTRPCVFSAHGACKCSDSRGTCNRDCLESCSVAAESVVVHALSVGSGMQIETGVSVMRSLKV